MIRKYSTHEKSNCDAHQYQLHLVSRFCPPMINTIFEQTMRKSIPSASNKSPGTDPRGSLARAMFPCIGGRGAPRRQRVSHLHVREAQAASKANNILSGIVLPHSEHLPPKEKKYHIQRQDPQTRLVSGFLRMEPRTTSCEAG